MRGGRRWAAIGELSPVVDRNGSRNQQGVSEKTIMVKKRLLHKWALFGSRAHLS
jgi:hypothetical protein